MKCRAPLFLLVALAAGLAAPAPVAFAQKGAPLEKLGTVVFPTGCSGAAQTKFVRGVALLHSFWFDAAAAAFTDVAKTDPTCGMAWWGVAMTALGNPLAAPPSPRALADGRAAVARARGAGVWTPRERDYIEAIATFYADADRVEHRTRALAYEKAMEALAARYPDDREASIFYALALNMTALPGDKTYANQLKAAGILERIFAAQPQHPGVAHYIIHSYDYPPIAEKGLDAARRYAAIAPSAPHALHMPSHIFTRRGYWPESIESNRASARAAKDAGNRLHALDYLAYAHLQRAEDADARKVLEQARGIGPSNTEYLGAAFALAAIPARYAVERHAWAEAATLAPAPSGFPWKRFPQAEAITVFARGLGAARRGNPAAARKQAARLDELYGALVEGKQAYWAEQVDIQRRVVVACATWAEGRREDALVRLREAALLEDATEKHPVTPGPIVPARELLGEMLLEAKQPSAALVEFETSQKVEPNRYRGLVGAARAAALAGYAAKAKEYYSALLGLVGAGAERPELREAKGFLGR